MHRNWLQQWKLLSVKINPINSVKDLRLKIGQGADFIFGHLASYTFSLDKAQKNREKSGPKLIFGCMFKPS